MIRLDKNKFICFNIGICKNNKLIVFVLQFYKYSLSIFNN